MKVALTTTIACRFQVIFVGSKVIEYRLLGLLENNRRYEYSEGDTNNKQRHDAFHLRSS